MNAQADAPLHHRVRALAANVADDRHAVEQDWRAARELARAAAEAARVTTTPRRGAVLLPLILTALVLASVLVAGPDAGLRGLVQFLAGALVALLLLIPRPWSLTDARGGRHPRRRPRSRGRHG